MSTAEILSLISLISYIIAGVSLVLAVFFWFFFKIPSVIGDLSGRTAKKSIARKRASNERSGGKGYQPSATNASRGKLTDTMQHSRKLMIGLLFIVIAVVLLAMRSLIRPSKNEPVKTAGVGVIKRRIQENCRTCFFVEFQDQNGNVHVGESIPYKSTKGKYYEDDTAKIKYYFSPKGRPFVIIDDPDLVSCEKESKPVGAVMLVAAITLIVIGVILLVSSFLA